MPLTAPSISTKHASPWLTWRTTSSWRFRHLRTVQRTIGFKAGTGGSSGVRFLQKALDLTFFPELYAVRTEIGR